MSRIALLCVLFLTLAAGVVMFITMLLKRKDGARFDKITAIASFLTSVASMIVGIATIKALSYEEERDKLQNQPLYSVSINPTYNEDKAFYDNEEFVVVNEGKKTKNATEVHQYAFLVISYTNMNKHEATKVKYCPLEYYFGANFITNNLDGLIVRSGYSGNNNELFYRLYMDALEFGQNHPGISLIIEKQHYFTMDYTDIFGESHTIVKNETSDVDADQFRDILQKSSTDAGGKSFSTQHLVLEEILQACLPEALEE